MNGGADEWSNAASWKDKWMDSVNDERMNVNDEWRNAALWMDGCYFMNER